MTIKRGPTFGNGQIYMKKRINSDKTETTQDLLGGWLMWGHKSFIRRMFAEKYL